jgi:hypothetical protein
MKNRVKDHYIDHFIADKGAVTLWAVVGNMNFVEVLFDFLFAILAFHLAFDT